MSEQNPREWAVAVITKTGERGRKVSPVFADRSGAANHRLKLTTMKAWAGVGFTLLSRPTGSETWDDEEEK